MNNLKEEKNGDRFFQMFLKGLTILCLMVAIFITKTDFVGATACSKAGYIGTFGGCTTSQYCDSSNTCQTLPASKTQSTLLSNKILYCPAPNYNYPAVDIHNGYGCAGKCQQDGTNLDENQVSCVNVNGAGNSAFRDFTALYYDLNSYEGNVYKRSYCNYTVIEADSNKCNAFCTYTKVKEWSACTFDGTGYTQYAVNTETVTDNTMLASNSACPSNDLTTRTCVPPATCYDSSATTTPKPLPDTGIDQTNLVAYWPFDGNANDAKGTRNLSGSGVTFTSSSASSSLGNSAYFNGGVSLNSTSTSNIVGTGDHSICLWYKEENPGYTHTQIISGREAYGSWTGFELQPNRNNNLLQATGLSFSPPPAYGTWSQVCYTKAGTTAKMYVNGNLVTSSTGVAVNNPFPNTGYPGTDAYVPGLYVGRDSQCSQDLYGACALGGWAAYEYFKGNMDDLSIWKRALSDCEVKSLYTGTDTCLPSCDTGCNVVVSKNNVKNFDVNYAKVPTSFSGPVNVTYLDLFNGGTLNSTSLADTDFFILGDTCLDYPACQSVSSGGNLSSVIRTITTPELSLLSQKYNSGMDVFLMGDGGTTGAPSYYPYEANNGTKAITDYLVPSFGFSSNFVTRAQGYYTPNYTIYPFLKGVVFDYSNGGMDTPGFMTSVPTGNCVDAHYGTGSCTVAYVPPSGTKGALLINGNAGVGSQTYLRKMIDDKCGYSSNDCHDTANTNNTVNVSGCQTLSSSNTTYKLTGDIISENATASTTSGTTACFPLRASNVVLDCQGHSITMKSGSTVNYGISAYFINPSAIADPLSYPYSPLTLKNCTISGFSDKDVFSKGEHVDGNFSNNGAKGLSVNLLSSHVGSISVNGEDSENGGGDGGYGGDVRLSGSTVTSVISRGGDANTGTESVQVDTGGNGGNIYNDSSTVGSYTLTGGTWVAGNNNNGADGVDGQVLLWPCGNPLNISCSVTPTTAATGTPVLWSTSASGGTPPYKYSWKFTDFADIVSSSTATSITKVYTTIGTGKKYATSTVSDAVSTITVSCPGTSTGGGSGDGVTINDGSVNCGSSHLTCIPETVTATDLEDTATDYKWSCVTTVCVEAKAPVQDQTLVNCGALIPPARLVNVNTNTTWDATNVSPCSSCIKSWTITDSNGTSNPPETISILNKIFTTIGLKEVSFTIASTTLNKYGVCTATTTVVQTGGTNGEI